MSLSSTSFTTASMVAKVKVALREAAAQGWAVVRDRKGRPLLECIHTGYKVMPFEFHHARQGDVSALVLAGARKFHAQVGAHA